MTEKKKHKFMKFNDPEEAVDYLTQQAVFQQIKQVKETEEDFTCTAHHGLGRWMRNNFGLWRDQTESPLVKWFWENLHLSHADDMSGVLLVMVYRRAKQQQLTMLDLTQMAEKYQEHWYKVMTGEIDGGTTLTFDK